MNGVVASLIVSGDNVGRRGIAALNKKMSRMVNDYAIEVVLCFSKPPQFKTPGNKIIFTYAKDSPPLQKAIVLSSGEILVFSTLKNFLADGRNVMLDQALNTKLDTMVAPYSVGLLGKVGLSKDRRIPYVIAKRTAILEIAYKAVSFNHLLDSASQDQVNVKLLPVDVHLPEYIDKVPSEKARRGSIKNTSSPGKPNFQMIEYTPHIPVFIISRDRLESLKKLVKWCEDEGLKNIFIVDNASTYPPLRKFLSNTPHEVINLAHNVGYLSPWTANVVDVYAKNQPYIVSDSDIVPLNGSHGAIKLFCTLLNKYPRFVKAGFGLKIDDIPKSYEPRDYVISWERKFWDKEVEKNVFDADIDTTFALWRANTQHTYGPSLRTGGKYVARHDTWYINSDKVSPEMLYYQSHADKVMGTWSTDPTGLAELYIRHKGKGRKPTSSKD